MVLAYGGASYKVTNDVKSVAHASGAESALAFAVPVLKYKGEQLFQTNTIVRYVADQLGLSPSGINGYKADALMALIQDCWLDVMKQKGKTLEEKEAFFTGRFKTFLDVFAAYLGDNDYFFGSENITSADLVFGMLAMFLQQMLGSRFDEFFTKAYPKLAANSKRVLENEKVAKFIADDPKSSMGMVIFEDAAAAASAETEKAAES